MAASVFQSSFLDTDHRDDPSIATGSTIDVAARRVLELSWRGVPPGEIVIHLANDPNVGPLRAADVYVAILSDLRSQGLIGARSAPSPALYALTGRAHERTYPWYDSVWLGRWMGARDVARLEAPELQAELIDRALPLRMPTNFDTHLRQGIVDESTSDRMCAVVRSLAASDRERHEAQDFGRTLVHNHSSFDDLHRAFLPLACELAGEELEPSYNFLSLYTNRGVCAPHMDAPSAKYTLDVCIEQSDPWPIYISQVVPWPEDWDYHGDDWEQRIKNDPVLDFQEYTLAPGDALFFAGSSQWHYRDPFPTTDDGFCHLIFFHFIPKGTRDFVRLFDPYLT